VYDDRGHRRGHESHDAAEEDHGCCTGEQRDRDPMSPEQVLIRAALGGVSRGTTRRPVAMRARRTHGTKP
jgi:hypothetical protein